MMHSCFRGVVVPIAAFAMFVAVCTAATAQVQTGTVPLQLTLACTQASELTFRLTLQNVSTAPTAAVIGFFFGSPRKYLPGRLRFTVSRAGVADTSFDYFDPTVVRIGGRIDPWLVTLPSGASYSIVVSIPSGFRQLFSAPADVHVSLTTQEFGSLNGDVEGLRFTPIWVGALTADRIAFPNSCPVTKR